MNTRTTNGKYTLTNAIVKESGDVLHISVATSKFPEAIMQINRDDWEKIYSKDYGRVSAFRPSKSHGLYARCLDKTTGKVVSVHRLVLGDEATKCTDHIDRNGLNNTRVNLRPVSHLTNALNSSIDSRSTTGIRGVTYLTAAASHRRPWSASIKLGPKRLSKTFKTKEEALAQRKAWELSMFNVPSPTTSRDEIVTWSK